VRAAPFPFLAPTMRNLVMRLQRPTNRMASMIAHSGRAEALSLFAALALLVAGAITVFAGEWADRSAKSSGPESPVIAYAAAIERADLAGALQQLMPDLRGRSSSSVAWQLGNRYNILESAVQTTAPLDRLLGTGDKTRAVVVVTMEIEGKGNPRWRTTEEMPVQLVDGRWLLAKTPLELPN